MKINRAEWKWHIFFLLVLGVMLYPILFAVSTSFKSMPEAFSGGFT